MKKKKDVENVQIHVQYFVVSEAANKYPPTYKPRPNYKTSYFERDTCVHGYHEYKAIWAAALAEELECRREPTNLVRL